MVSQQPTFSPRTLSILGVTGSIGTSTRGVLAANPGAFRIEAVASGRDVIKLAAAARELGARFAAIADPACYGPLKDALAGTGVEVAAGLDAIVEAALYPADIVVGAITGTAGLASTHAAVGRGATVALANKESLVCAGDLVMRTARENGATVLPLDSEHNALFQALGANRPEDVEEMILTASGGPFRTWEADRIAAATPAEALKHPNWSMGSKVTIDSASLMNKGLEVIEAHHLFAMPARKLSVLVHPQSIVHGLVRFVDGAVTAELASTDMKVPIANCLGFPVRIRSGAASLDLARIGSLTFEAPDFARFPCLRLAFEALIAGGAAPSVLNAANEIAVAAFLECRIPFGHIPAVVERSLERFTGRLSGAPVTIEDALSIDHAVRKSAVEEVERLALLAG